MANGDAVDSALASYPVTLGLILGIPHFLDVMLLRFFDSSALISDTGQRHKGSIAI